VAAEAGLDDELLAPIGLGELEKEDALVGTTDKKGGKRTKLDYGEQHPRSGDEGAIWSYV
jgi:hypothetical protein